MGCDKSKPEVQQTTTVRDEIPEYKVIVIGDSSVGKTAIIHQYISGAFSRGHTPTTGV